MSRLVLAAAMLAAMALALGACTGGTSEQPTGSGTSSTPPSEAPSPSATSSGPVESSTPSAVQPPAGYWELDARLHAGSAFPQASGRSEYDQEGTSRELEVELTQVRRLAGARVTVYLNDTEVGTMPVAGDGTAFREWDTDRGQRVPSAAAGSRVEVRGRNGAVIASGIYRPEPN